MKEICGDKAPNLTRAEKIKYLLQNFVIGILGYFPPVRIPFWYPKKIDFIATLTPSRALLNAFLREELPKYLPDRAIKVLDIGCGSGYIRSILTEIDAYGEYVGCDISDHPDFAQLSSPNFKSEFVHSDVLMLDLNKKFDIIVSLTSLEHIQNDHKAIKICTKHLFEKGYQIYALPSFWALFLYIFHGWRQYTPKSLKKLFKKADITIYRLGGVFSFVFHFFCITLPELILKTKRLRSTAFYRKLLHISIFLDKYIPLCSTIYIVLCKHKSIDDIDNAF